MNHRAAPACWSTRASSASAVGTTRMTPSPPIPAWRSASRAACALVSGRDPSRSGTSTKSFSVPWPLVKGVWSAMGPIVPDDLEGPREQSVPRAGRGVEPVDAGVGVEPGLLPPGEPPGQRRRLLLGLLLVERPVELGQRLGVAERTRGGAALAQPQLVERPHLVQETRLPHVLDARPDARVQLGAPDP